MAASWSEAMLTTWFLASDELVAERFQLGVVRELRDPSTNGVMKAAGPAWEPLSDLAYFQIDDIELATVALLFDIAELDVLDRTRALTGTEEGKSSFASGLPALYRVPAEAVAAFRKGLAKRSQRARSFGESVRAKGLRVGIDIGASPPFLERSGAWRAEVLPDTETELFEAFATLLEDAEPGMAILALAEDT
jgi:hypothetical protein